MAGQLSPEQIVRRMCIWIERCDKAMDDELLGQMRDVPVKVRHRLLHAIDQLRDKWIQNEVQL